MEKEEKKVDSTTKSPAPATETKKEEEKVVDTTGQQEEDKVDYKAELEKVQKKLGQAEYKLTEQDKELRRKKEADKTPELDDDDDDEKQVLGDLVEKEVKRVQEVLVRDMIEDTLDETTKNPDERVLIKWYYDNKIVKSGFTKRDIVSDINDAKLLANRQKYEKRMDEVKEALKAKAGESNGSTTGQQETPTELPKLSPQEERILARHGLTAKDIKKVN